MTDWNYADVWEIVADAQPDAVAVTQGGRNVRWDEFDRGADGVAQFLLDAGAARQDKVALYLYNGPEYIETTFAAFKAGLVPVNTNYRYGDDELIYLWDNADAVAVVFHGSLRRTRRARPRAECRRCGRWLWVDDGRARARTGRCRTRTRPQSATDRAVPPWGRSGDDLLLLYTGGTTGMPKGVMWRQDDLFDVPQRRRQRGTSASTAELEERRARSAASPGGVIAAARRPLMHGTGQFTALSDADRGGSVVTARGPHVRRRRAARRDRAAKVSTAIVIVGEAFAQPMLARARRQPGPVGPVEPRSSIVTRPASMWSEENKEGLLATTAPCC